MALLTLAQVRENIETGLSDAALQRVMNSAEEDINQRHGAIDTQTDDIEGNLKSLWTNRPISSITSVTETIGTVDTVLSSDDYTRRHDRQMDRENDGTNPRQRWGDRVTIIYVPVDDTHRRVTVYLKLILMEIVFSGLDSSREGDFNSKSLDYTSEREKLLGSLSRPAGFI